MKKLSYIVFALFCLMESWGQPPTRFYATFGGEGDDIGYSGKVTLDNHYIIAGSTSSYGNDNTDVYLVKLSNMGVGLWTKHIGGIGNDVGKSVIQLPDSGYVIAGYTSSYGAGGYDAYLVKTDKEGNFIWQRTFGGEDWDFANDLVLGADGNIYVVGYTESMGAGKRDGFILKYDVFGNLLTHKLIGGVENEELRSIIKTNDNLLVTVGYTESGKDFDGDGYFIKMDTNLDTIFTTTFGGPYRDFANDVVQKTNDQYYIGGAKTYTLDGKTHSYMHRVTPSGQFVSDSSYFRNGDHEAFSSVANSLKKWDLTAFVRTISKSLVQLQAEIILAELDGYVHKVNDQGGFADDFVYSVEATSDGGYIMVGSTLSYSAVGRNVFFVKHDSTIFNYVSIVGIEREIISIQKPRILHSENGEIKIQFPIDKIPVQIGISDLSGRKLQVIENHEGSNEIEIRNLENSIVLIFYTYPDGAIQFDKIILR